MNPELVVKKDQHSNHLAIDVKGCDFKLMEAFEFWEDLVKEALGKTSIQLIDSSFHKFEPQGITATFLLSTSHLSLHTWPENGSYCLDVFSCGGVEEPYIIINHILNKTIPEEFVLHELVRNWSR